jgi:hypothetical protein
LKTAREWKSYYAQERERLGRAGLCACLDRAEALAEQPVAGQGALVFPHTRLEASGELTAAAALAVLRSGCEDVLALGVLHGARQGDAALVQRARQGEEPALSLLRRLHGPGVPEDAGRWREEFSLDNFCALLEAAAGRAGKRRPRVIRRFPFLVGETPGNLPGAEELEQWIARGAVLVATADPIHHGAGYGTPDAECLPLAGARALEFARATVERGFGLLAVRDYAGFLRDAAAVRSDFRDVGPVMAQLLPGPRCEATVHRVELVDYADALGAPQPTWVAGALAAFSGAER